MIEKSILLIICVVGFIISFGYLLWNIVKKETTTENST